MFELILALTGAFLGGKYGSDWAGAPGMLIGGGLGGFSGYLLGIVVGDSLKYIVIIAGIAGGLYFLAASGAFRGTAIGRDLEDIASGSSGGFSLFGGKGDGDGDRDRDREESEFEKRKRRNQRDDDDRREFSDEDEERGGRGREPNSYEKPKRRSGSGSGSKDWYNDGVKRQSQQPRRPRREVEDRDR